VKYQAVIINKIETFSGDFINKYETSGSGAAEQGAAGAAVPRPGRMRRIRTKALIIPGAMIYFNIMFICHKRAGRSDGDS
jgi:hypothetical protein